MARQRFQRQARAKSTIGMQPVTRPPHRLEVGMAAGAGAGEEPAGVVRDGAVPAGAEDLGDPVGAGALGDPVGAEALGVLAGAGRTPLA
jgi:hypothetical protein